MTDMTDVAADLRLFYFRRMRRWGIALVFVLVLLLLFGGIGSGVFFVLVMAAVVLIVFGGFLARDDPEGPASGSVVEVGGVSWTRGANGAFMRWNADAQRWEDALPSPVVARSFGDRPTTPPARNRRVVAALGVVVLVGLTLWAFVDPHADIPGISRVVCSLKGAAWQDGSAPLGIEPGCYRREP